MDKEKVKAAMLAMEERAFEHAREHYLEFVASAQLDRSEPIENDELAQAESASELSEAFDQPVHNHADKVVKLKNTDFGPKSEVEEGAIVKIGGRNFVIAVSTTKFTCDDQEYMGISAKAPIFDAMEGKRKGDTFKIGGKSLAIEDVQ